MKIRIAYSVALAAVVISAGSCKSKETPSAPSQTTPTAPSSAATTSASGAPTTEAPAASPADLSALKTQAQTVFKAWLKAQNEGQFDAYEKLYADKFYGVKRVASRSYRYDRAGWIEDRKRLFARPVTVAVAGLTVSVTPQTAILRFKQTWQTPTFKDIGVKQLVFNMHADGYRITREEMLSSRTGAAGDGASALKNSFLVKHVAGRHFVVLAHTDPHDFERMVEGHPTFLDMTASLRPVRESLLPANASKLRSAAFQLYGAQGLACTSKVRASAVLSNATPHFGAVNAWRGKEPGTPAATKPQIATALWRMTRGHGRTLVFELEQGCDAGLVAIPKSAPAIGTLWSPTTPNEAQRKLALESFTSTPEYQAIQRQFKEETGKSTPWHTYNGASLTVSLFKHDTAGSYLVVGGRGEGGCADFYGELTTFWKLQRKPVRLGSNTTLIPQLALDADGDGLPEFITQGAFAGQRKGRLEKLLDVSAPNFDCTC